MSTIAIGAAVFLAAGVQHCAHGTSFSMLSGHVEDNVRRLARMACVSVIYDPLDIPELQRQFTRPISGETDIAEAFSQILLGTTFHAVVSAHDYFYIEPLTIPVVTVKPKPRRRPITITVCIRDICSSGKSY